MRQRTLVLDIAEQTRRALWEVRNVMDCVPQALWSRPYCGMPVWKHIYHMLHSLDRWFANPRDPAYQEPPFHTPGLNDLDTPPQGSLSRETLTAYLTQVGERTMAYLEELDDAALEERPQGCEFTRMTLILGQHRHLSTHMGMLMGFIIAETGRWPRVLGLERPMPQGTYDRFF
ncbi:MAG: DinB family protein [Clostridiales bacterium]|nr:DinB family protein [Clostridiales bacterium]MDO4350500.1 DinB family protein [Eubacteriales bacterium]MDY4009045.1 DinB family protein [Candidatus Limiplasma sp.]